MTTDMGKFVIDDGQTELVTIADVASAAAFSGVIIDALRGGLNVKYQQTTVIQIGAPEPKPAPAPEPPTAKAAKATKATKAAKATKPVKVARKPRTTRMPRTPRTTDREKLASILSKDPVHQPAHQPAHQLAALVEVQSKWKQGDVVFLAWKSMSELAKRTFAEWCEAMGTVAEFRRGKGIRRTIGVQFDNADMLVWLAADELSDKCEYCIESQRRGALHEVNADDGHDGHDADLEDVFEVEPA